MKITCRDVQMCNRICFAKSLTVIFLYQCHSECNFDIVTLRYSVYYFSLGTWEKQGNLGTFPAEVHGISHSKAFTLKRLLALLPQALSLSSIEQINKLGTTCAIWHLSPSLPPLSLSCSSCANIITLNIIIIIIALSAWIFHWWFWLLHACLLCPWLAAWSIVQCSSLLCWLPLLPTSNLSMCWVDWTSWDLSYSSFDK